MLIDAKSTLGLLLPAIDGIDGGCIDCIIRFTVQANLALEKADVPYRFEFRRRNRVGSRVCVVEVMDEID